MFMCALTPVVSASVLLHYFMELHTHMYAVCNACHRQMQMAHERGIPRWNITYVFTISKINQLS